MFEVNDKMRSMFCKETGAPIMVYKKGYFEERLNAYGLDFCFQEFIAQVRNPKNQDEECKEVLNRLYNNKMKLVERLKLKEDYIDFNKLDMSQFDSRYNLPKGDIYNGTNVGKRFISVDLREANFVALAYTRKFGLDILDGATNYFDFSMGLDFELNSDWKGTRQFLFGNLNPKRQIKIQKFIIEQLIDYLIENLDGFTIDNVVKINNDELIITRSEDTCLFNKLDIVDMSKKFSNILLKDLNLIYFNGVFKVEDFCLRHVPKLSCYVKVDDGWRGVVLDNVKCLNKLYVPLFMRALKDEPVMPNDLLFYNEKNLSMLLEYPKLTNKELMENLGLIKDECVPNVKKVNVNHPPF